MYCSQCGKLLPTQVPYCPHCGSKIIEETLLYPPNWLSSLPMKANLKLCISKLADFSGRATRGEFWKYMLVLGLLSLLAIILLFVVPVAMGLAEDYEFYIVMGINFVAMLVLWAASLSVTVRRLHDVGFSGWWYFLNFIPNGSVVVFIFLCRASQPNENRYGPLPDYFEIKSNMQNIS